MTDLELRIRVLLTMQSALLGAIGRNVRAVVCQWDFDSIHVRSIFDGEISIADNELMDDVEVEVISHFPDAAVSVGCVRDDAPGRIYLEEGEVYVYRRFEHSSTR